MSLLQVTSCGRQIDLAIAQDLSLTLVDVGPAASSVLELADEGMGSSFSIPVCDGSMTVQAVDYSPLSLFQAGEQGVWFDPSDFSTMFQDSAGTTPVTAVGQAVGRILDKSGRGNHATQATAAARPVLRQDSSGRYYLEFDGVDDCLFTSSFNPGSVDKLQSFFGIRKLSDVASGCVFETSAASNANAGAANAFAPSPAGSPVYGFRARGTGSTSVISTSTNYAAPITNVVTGIGDISGDVRTIRINGAQDVTSAADLGTGNFLNYPLYVGRRNNNNTPLNGWLYGLIVRFSSTNLDAAAIANVERWMNGKTGAY
jgi:hypothetical protein